MERKKKSRVKILTSNLLSVSHYLSAFFTKAAKLYFKLSNVTHVLSSHQDYGLKRKESLLTQLEMIRKSTYILACMITTALSLDINQTAGSGGI